MQTHSSSSIRERIARIAMVATVACCVSCLFSGCRALENQFIFAPAVYPRGWNPIADDQIEEVWFDTIDGQKLHGLLAHHPNPRAVILFAHGRRGNVTTPIEKLSAFVDRHTVSVLIFDYRGFGKSTGKPDENGLYKDARAARSFLAHSYRIPESEIILMGRSLGAAVAIELAASDGAKALIVESGFTSLPDFVKHHIPIPARSILVSRFDSVEKLKTYHGPAFFSHGTNDKIIPFEQGLQLFEAAAGPKRFVRIDNGKHSSEPTPEYIAELDQFIEDVIR